MIHWDKDQKLAKHIYSVKSQDSSYSSMRHRGFSRNINNVLVLDPSVVDMAVLVLKNLLSRTLIIHSLSVGMLQ